MPWLPSGSSAWSLRTGPPPKRAPPPPQLPCTLIRYEPENTHCRCGCQLKCIGEDISEKLDYSTGLQLETVGSADALPGRRRDADRQQLGGKPDPALGSGAQQLAIRGLTAQWPARRRRHESDPIVPCCWMWQVDLDAENYLSEIRVRRVARWVCGVA